MKLQLILRALGVTLLGVAILGVNGAIWYSSVPHYQQMGWAEFCGVNAIWIGALGAITLAIAESSDVAMHDLQWERQKEGAK